MTKTKVAPGALTIRPLSPETWDAFADLAERPNGVCGGCYSRPKGIQHRVLTRTVAPAEH